MRQRSVIQHVCGSATSRAGEGRKGTLTNWNVQPELPSNLMFRSKTPALKFHPALRVYSECFAFDMGSLKFPAPRKCLKESPGSVWRSLRRTKLKYWLSRSLMRKSQLCRNGLKLPNAYFLKVFFEQGDLRPLAAGFLEGEAEVDPVAGISGERANSSHRWFAARTDKSGKRPVLPLTGDASRCGDHQTPACRWRVHHSIFSLSSSLSLNPGIPAMEVTSAAPATNAQTLNDLIRSVSFKSERGRAPSRLDRSAEKRLTAAKVLYAPMSGRRTPSQPHFQRWLSAARVCSAPACGVVVPRYAQLT